MVVIFVVLVLVVVISTLACHSRHGESMFNTQGLIGGNPPLSPLGEQYAEVLVDYVEQSDELSTDEVPNCVHY